jgi:cardiolipin synthase
LIGAARRTITLSMAYFIPVGRVWHELLRARRRGVRIRVIVPGQSDVRLAEWATRYLYSALLRRRICVYERAVEMLHSKVMVVDNQWTVVGSCNLDARSLFINLEFLAVIRSRAFARAVNDICKYELERSQRVTRKSCYRRRLWQRLLERMAWSLRWWL